MILFNESNIARLNFIIKIFNLKLNNLIDNLTKKKNLNSLFFLYIF